MPAAPRRIPSFGATAPARADSLPAENPPGDEDASSREESPGEAAAEDEAAPSFLETAMPLAVPPVVQTLPALVEIELSLRLRCAHCDAETRLWLTEHGWTGAVGIGADRCAGCGRTLRVEIPPAQVTDPARAALGDINARLTEAGLTVAEETVYVFGHGSGV